MNQKLLIFFLFISLLVGIERASRSSLNFLSSALTIRPSHLSFFCFSLPNHPHSLLFVPLVLFPKMLPLSAHISISYKFSFNISVSLHVIFIFNPNSSPCIYIWCNRMLDGNHKKALKIFLMLFWFSKTTHQTAVTCLCRITWSMFDWFSSIQYKELLHAFGKSQLLCNNTIV